MPYRPHDNPAQKDFGQDRIKVTSLSQLALEGAYLIIEQGIDISYPSGNTPEDEAIKALFRQKGDTHVFEIRTGRTVVFEGGYFTSSSDNVEISFRNSNIVVPPYCIFRRQYGTLVPLSLKVTGFTGDCVRAAWFDDGLKTLVNQGDEEFINRALVAAAGCPVQLECRVYNIMGSIIFPKLQSEYDVQTLNCPGTIHIVPYELINVETGRPEKIGFPAFIIERSYVNLTVACISGTRVSMFDRQASASGKSTSDGEITLPPIVIPPISTEYNVGTGVLFRQRAFYCNVTIKKMYYLEKGFDFTPNAVVVWDEKQKEYVDAPGGIQYCSINFDSIGADYGIFLDPISNQKANLPTDSADSSEIRFEHWISEINFNGGRMDGHYGIYVQKFPDEKESAIGQINGNTFNNIAFDGITQKAIVFRNSEFNYFNGIFFASNMPGNYPEDISKVWVEFENVTDIVMSVHGYIRPYRFAGLNYANNIVIEGDVVDNSWYINRFDRLVFRDLNTESRYIRSPHKFLCSSIMPFNMSQTLVKRDINPLSVEYSLADLLPEIQTYGAKGEYPKCTVLPRSVELSFGLNANVTINLAGLKDFAPCLFDINVAALGSGSSIKFISTYGTDGKEDFQIAVGLPGGPVVHDATISKSGLYRLNWSNNWTLYITEV